MKRTSSELVAEQAPGRAAFLMEKLRLGFVAPWQAARRSVLRQRISMLRTELQELEMARSTDDVIEAHSGRRWSAPAFRTSVLEAEAALRRSKLDGLLGRPDETVVPRHHSQAAAPGSATDRGTGESRRIAVPTGYKFLGVVAFLGVALTIIVARAWSAIELGKDVEEPVGNKIAVIAPAISAPAVEQGKLFFASEIELDYSGGRVVLSGEPSLVGSFSVDDAMMVMVLHSDLSSATWAHTFNIDCFSNSVVGPQDLTWMFVPGVNTVRIELSDICGATWGTSGSILLTNEAR